MVENDSILSPEISYTLGSFLFFLDENTGDLKIIVHPNGEHLRITPKSDNSIMVHACSSKK